MKDPTNAVEKLLKLFDKQEQATFAYSYALGYFRRAYKDFYEAIQDQDAAALERAYRQLIESENIDLGARAQCVFKTQEDIHNLINGFLMEAEEGEE